MPGGDPRIMRLFTLERGDSPGDFQPELHVVGLAGTEVVAIFDHLRRLGGRFDDRTFHLVAEARDVTVRERPDVAKLVVEGLAQACLWGDGVTVDGVELPTLSMFLYADHVELFWDAGPPWTNRSAGAFVSLLGQILDMAPGAALRPDPHQAPAVRRDFGDALAEKLGRPGRIDLGSG